MEAARVLVVDDEVKIRELLRTYLEREGFQVGEAGSGEDAINEFSLNKFDIVILDLMMPGMDGWEVCREIRKISFVPIIMLTARGEEIDRVLGLEMGADDYVVKPFSPREMVARVKAILRRNDGQGRQNQDANSEIVLGRLVIRPEKREVKAADKVVQLTPKEYQLLYIMASSPGKVFTREHLLEKIWGYDFYGEARTVDTHVTRLREKLAKSDTENNYIATVWGVGYKIEVKHAL